MGRAELQALTLHDEQWGAGSPLLLIAGIPARRRPPPAQTEGSGASASARVIVARAFHALGKPA
jgi:hypothetical protein